MASLIGKIVNKAAETPVPFASRASAWALPWTNRSDTETQLRAMGGVGTLFGIVNRTSNAVSQVDWHLYRKAKSGKDEDREEVTSHAALDIWNKPNPFFHRQLFVETFTQHLDLTGEGWWVIARHPAMRSLPLELWPVRPDRMTPIPHPTKYLSGYVYTSPDGEQVPLELDEVIQLRMPNPVDPYRGMGPVQSVLVDLDATKYSAQWNRNFFLNSAEPGGVIEIDRRLGDEEFNELRDRWNEQHRGVARAHRVAILEQGKWIDRKFTQRDMQFAELRSVSRDTIMEAFGFPKSMLGITEDVNRANGENGENVFAKWLTVPRLERIKGALNHLFLPLFGDTARDLEWDYDSPVEEDDAAENAERESKATAAKTLIDAGFDPAAVLVTVGLPDMPVRETPEPMPAPAPEPPALNLDAVRTALRAELTARPATCTHDHRAVRNADDPELPTPPDGVPAEDVEAVDAVDLSPVQAAFEAAITGLLATWMGSIVIGWIDDLVDAIRAIIASGNLADLAQLSVDTSDAGQELLDAMVDLAEKAAGHVVDEAKDQDVTLDPVVPGRHDLAPRADTTAALEGQRYAASAGREAARIAGGELTADEVAEHVRTHLEELAESSARPQLAGALTGAQNTARAQTLKAGPVGSLYASEQMDRGTCKPCRAIHGRWIANTDDLTALFKLYPGAGYINCLGGYYCRGTYVGVWRPEQTEGQ